MSKRSTHTPKALRWAPRASAFLVMLALTPLIFAVLAATALAAPLPNPTPTPTAATRVATAIPCLVVAKSGCPQATSSAPVGVQAPGSVVVVGANWTPGAAVTVLLVPAAQPCATSPASSTQTRASTAGVFSVAVRLPDSASNGTLYGLCATTADGKQTFPTAGIAAPSPLRLRVVRPPPPATAAPSPPIDGYSLAALLLAALSAGVFVFTWLRGRRAKASADR